MDFTREELQELIRNGIVEALNQRRACMTVAECARYCRIGEEKIRELVARQNTDFPYFKVGVKVLINKVLLDQWLDKVAAEKRCL